MAEHASALSSVPVADSHRRPAQLLFFYGPMDCGKSTLALQINHNHARQGRRGLLLTQFDRSGQATITSRTGMTRQATEIDADTDLTELARQVWEAGDRLDYLIVDEAQFLTADQVDQLACLVDDNGVDSYCFGLATDFRSELFAGARRLFELADEVRRLQVEVLCWCGERASMNGRLVNGVLVREGEQVLVADVATDGRPVDVHYQVLCRRHWRTGEVGRQRPQQEALPLN